MLIVAASPVYAQDNGSENKELRYEFRGESMITVLDRVANDTGIDLVYDPELIRDIIVYKRVNQTSVAGLLQAILTDYRLDYLTLSSGTYVIVRTSRSGPSYGTLSGLVLDSETGEPLPGATVLLADAEGGTSTNQNGHFSMNRLISGTHHLIISYMGYESAFRTITIEPDGSAQERIGLSQSPMDIAPILVESHRPFLPSTNSGSTMDMQRNLQNPDFSGSPIRSLNLMNGVQYGLPMKDLNLQGSDQGQHRIVLDGMPIYNPYSFGKLISSFSPYSIGSVTLHKAGYGSDVGSTTAGQVNLNHDLRPDSPNGAMLQFDPSSVNFRGDLSLPFNNGRSLKLMGALRTSYWDLYRDPARQEALKNWDRLDPLITNAVMDLDVDAGRYSTIEHRADLSYYDLHFAGQYSPDDFSRIRFSAYAADNRVSTGLINQQTEDVNIPGYLYAVDGHDWSNRMMQLQWARMISPRLDLNIQAGYSENRFNHENRAGVTDFRPGDNFFSVLSSSSDFDAIPESGRLLPTQIDGNLIRHFQISGDATYSFLPSFSINGGFKAERIYSEVTISEPSAASTDSDQYSTLLSGFLNAKHQVGFHWRFSYGSRLTWLNTTNRAYAEPRASAQYDQPESAVGYWSFRIAGGLYRQFINEYRITNTGPTAIVPEIPIWSHTGDTAIPKAWHVSTSLLIEPTDQTSITAEWFYKWHPSANFTTYIEPDEESPENPGEVSAFGISTTMRSWGFGVRYTQSFADRFLRITAGYDYSFAEIGLNEQFGRSVTTPWNEPHRFNLSALVRIRQNLMLTAAWQGILGRSWAYRRAYYNYLLFDDSSAELTGRFGNPGDDKLPAFHQADVMMVWQAPLGSTNLELRAGLINVLNRKNVLEKTLIPTYQGESQTGFREQERRMPGIYPNFSMRIRL
jgi:hypothetical protein